MTYDPASEQLTEDGDPREVRNETPGERLDRKWNDILQELRVVMTGTQLITGFLLAVAFQPKFDELERSEVVLYLVLVVLATTATMLGLAPVILHRQLSGQKQKERVVRIANGLLLSLLVVVSLVAAGVAMLIFDVTVSRPAGWIAGSIALVLLLVFWIVVPRIGRREPKQR
jgi:cytochrome bd-type quinol oxidase subunit 2